MADKAAGKVKEVKARRRSKKGAELKQKVRSVLSFILCVLHCTGGIVELDDIQLDDGGMNSNQMM